MAGTGDPRGFLTIKRAEPQRRPVQERTKDWREFYVPTPDEHFRTQGARCMDCGVPFCQGDTGCPVQNVIPEWNDARPRRPLAGRVARAARDEQLPRADGTPLPGAL